MLVWAAWSAGAAGDAPPTLEQRVTSLAHEEWSVREEAMYALMEHDGVDDTVLKAAFATARTPEQRHRLTRIALHRYYLRAGRDMNAANNAVEPAKDTAGLGVDLSKGPARIVQPYQHPQLRADNTPAVLITDAMPGFPAFSHLRPGDMVVGLGGEPFGEGLDVQGFIDRIQKYKPGDKVTFRVLRGDKFLDVTLTTDSKRRLDVVYGYDPKDVQWAMRQPEFRAYLASIGGEGLESAPILIEAPAAPGTAGPNPRPTGP